MTVAGPWTFSSDDPAGSELENRLQDMFDFFAGLVTPIQGFPLFIGTGNPNGAVTASPPAIYLNRAGGAATTLWVKEAGVNTNLNWVGK